MDKNDIGTLSLIVPAYNEISAMGNFLGSLKETLSGISVKHEIIVVDDGSDDGTAELAERQGLNVIRHRSRKG
jgi:glycosyltransferase involved in cell wall biosynthesis